jgi:elongation factor Tu
MSGDPLFHMVIEDVFSIANRGTVVTGRIDSGTVKAGDELMIKGKDGERRATVAGVEAFHKILEEAHAGDTVGVLLKDAARANIQRGDELVSPGLDFTWKP